MFCPDVLTVHVSSEGHSSDPMLAGKQQSDSLSPAVEPIRYLPQMQIWMMSAIPTRPTSLGPWPCAPPLFGSSSPLVV